MALFVMVLKKIMAMMMILNFMISRLSSDENRCSMSIYTGMAEGLSGRRIFFEKKMVTKSQKA